MSKDSISREARERKATKPDKAPVPAYLWREHLINDNPSGVPWPESSLKKLDKALDFMRAWAI